MPSGALACPVLGLPRFVKAAVCALLCLWCLMLSPLALADCADILKHDMQALRSQGQPINLCARYAGKPLIVAITASFSALYPAVQRPGGPGLFSVTGKSRS